MPPQIITVWGLKKAKLDGRGLSGIAKAVEWAQLLRHFYASFPATWCFSEFIWS